MRLALAVLSIGILACAKTAPSVDPCASPPVGDHSEWCAKCPDQCKGQPGGGVTATAKADDLCSQPPPIGYNPQWCAKCPDQCKGQPGGGVTAAAKAQDKK